jgi:hypothetical protein
MRFLSISVSILFAAMLAVPASADLKTFYFKTYIYQGGEFPETTGTTQYGLFQFDDSITPVYQSATGTAWHDSSIRVAIFNAGGPAILDQSDGYMSFDTQSDYQEFGVSAILDGGGEESFLLTDRTSNLDVFDLPTAFPSLPDPQAEYQAVLGGAFPFIFAGFGYGPDLMEEPELSTGGFAQFITEDEFNSAVLSDQPTPTPEPASWMLMMLGFGALGSASRYRRRQISAQF